jgi:hypothetical protein
MKSKSFTLIELLTFFNCSINKVKVYDYALSLSQIQKEYVVGLNLFLLKEDILKEERDQSLSNLSLQ